MISSANRINNLEDVEADEAWVMPKPMWMIVSSKRARNDDYA